MRVFRLFPIVFVLVGLLVGLPTPSQAQTDPAVCTALVKKALQDTSTICKDLGQGAVCYGNKNVEATPADPSQNPAFANPGDQAMISALKTVHTGALDVSSQQFGIAALNLGTLAPDGTANPATMALMAGDVTLQFVPPTANPPTGFTPVQTIQVKGASEAPACDGAQALFALRSQDNTPVPLTINGSNVILSALVTFHWESANSLSATVHTGSLQVGDGPKAEAGQTLVAVTDNDGTIVLWSTQRTATDKEVQDLADLDGLSGPLTAFVAPAGCPTTTYVVQPGETLFRIATRYNTTVAALAAANNISDPNTIYSGQRLIISSCGQNVAANAPQPAANNQPSSQPTAQPNNPAATPPPGATNVALDCGNGGQALPGNTISQITQLYGSALGGILGSNGGGGMPSSGQNLSFPCK